MEYIESLNNSASIIPLDQQLLNSIINTKDQATKIGHQMKINAGTRDKYKIWLHLLKRKNEGISNNNID